MSHQKFADCKLRNSSEVSIIRQVSEEDTIPNDPSTIEAHSAAFVQGRFYALNPSVNTNVTGLTQQTSFDMPSSHDRSLTKSSVSRPMEASKLSKRPSNV